MSKALDALEGLIETFYNKESEDIQIVRKELKALEIIREKKVDTEKLWLVTNACSYNKFFGKVGVIPITQQDYDLLKEVLRNE